MTPQPSIAHYRITSKLGEGGMGAVYRATDTKLNRDVAIKVLPDSFANDPDRLARFTREAQVLAQLNHPNIAQIYGVEDRALVMELVEGAELKGPVPVDTAVGYAKQLAAALEAAHEKGIVHRDLKPANIKITPDGVLKVLDFGLAKAAEERPAPSAASPTISPTLSLEMTQAGMILGTAAYMSPEQARGKAVDKRADIWAFGVVFFEMLTGAMLFRGETASDSMIAVATREPDWSALPADTPPHVRKLLALCLRKDPQQRLRDIGDARITLGEPEPGVPAAKATLTRRQWLPWTAASLCAATAGGVWLRPRPAQPSQLTTRFQLPFPENAAEILTGGAPNAVPSPDGRYLAFIAGDRYGVAHLWVRPLNSVSARVFEKTGGAAFPFWSPDSKSIAFFADMSLKRIDLTGETPITLCDVQGRSVFFGRTAGEGGAWNRENVIVFSADSMGGLYRVSAQGGPAIPLTSPQQTGDIGHMWPQFLPSGRILYLAHSADPAKSGLYAQEPDGPGRVKVLSTELRGVWAPPGYLLFVRGGTLFAQRMSGSTFQLEGAPLPVAEDVGYGNGTGRTSFAVSENGLLVYSGGSANSVQLTWVNRDGNTMAPIGPPGPYLSIMLSPDEKNAAVLSSSSMVGSRLNLLIVDLDTGLIRQMTQDGKLGTFLGPWAPDSRRLAVNLVNGGILEMEVASGNTSVLAKDTFQAEDWSPDGRTLLATDYATRGQLVQFLAGGPGKPQALSNTPFRKTNFRFSPDGKFVVYQSREFERAGEVFVAAFPSFAPKRQISSGGAVFPLWRRDGKEIFFRGSENQLMSVPIQTGTTIEASAQKAVFEYGRRGSDGNRFAVSADGKRFLVMNPVKTGSQELMATAILNWQAELNHP